MYPTQGLFMTIATGAVCQKYYGSNENGSFAYVTLVREEVHKESTAKHYLKLRLRGKQADYINNFVNKGDSLIAQGDLVNERERETGKVTETLLRVSVIQSHQLPSRATYDRIMNAMAARQEANNESQGGQPQQPQEPPQQMVQQGQNQDFDDDIPF